MILSKKQLVICVCLSLMFFLSGKAALAEGQKQAISDMRILIDVSGSMKQNDPNNLRSPALKLLVGLLPNNSRAGVWTFGKEVNMQVKIDNVSPAWKKYARKEAKNIHSLGLFTNIEDAIRRATWDWKEPDPAYERTLILLTDGMVDISKSPSLNDNSRQRILSELLPKLSNANAKVHTIALSKNADHTLLQKLADRTNGWYSSVSSANELKRKFLHLFEKSTQVDTIPLKGNSFTVDNSVSEMTVLIFKTSDSKPTELVTPAGVQLNKKTIHKGLQWHSEPGYDMITINKPEPGKWNAIADIDPDNRVLVVTNLKLKSNKFTNNFLKGDIITVYADLEEDNKIIRKQEFLNLVNFNLKVNKKGNAYKFNDSGDMPDAKPKDGIYSSIIETAGLEESNNVLIQAKGATFDRQIRHSFKVFKSPFDISVSEPAAEEPFELTISVKPTLFVKKSINIQVELPDGKTLKAKSLANQEWVSNIPMSYQGINLQVTLSGKRYNKTEPYQYTESFSLPSIAHEEAVKEDPEVNQKQMTVPEKMETPKEIALPKEPEPTPPVLKEEVKPEKIAEPTVKAEEKPEVTPAPEVPEMEMEPEPEEKANWIVVFLIVLIGNAILIAGTTYGYFYWKKQRDSVLEKEHSEFEEDSPDKPLSEQPSDAISEDEVKSEGGDEDQPAESSDDQTEQDASSAEPETSEQDDLDISNELLSGDDDDILKQQLGMEDNEPDGATETEDADVTPATDASTEEEDDTTETDSSEQPETIPDEVNELTEIQTEVSEPETVEETDISADLISDMELDKQLGKSSETESIHESDAVLEESTDTESTTAQVEITEPESIEAIEKTADKAPAGEPSDLSEDIISAESTEELEAKTDQTPELETSDQLNETDSSKQSEIISGDATEVDLAEIQSAISESETLDEIAVNETTETKSNEKSDDAPEDIPAIESTDEPSETSSTEPLSEIQETEPGLEDEANVTEQDDKLDLELEDTESILADLDVEIENISEMITDKSEESETNEADKEAKS